MEGWQVPGLAVAAVRDGRVVLMRTYGVRDADAGDPVTPRTGFALGSITKSLTGIALALAAAEGRLDLDGPARRRVAALPAGVTARHLLSHTAGWPRHDALWYLDAWGREELVARLSVLPRFAAPGRAFQYNNVPFAAAGLVLERATGESWESYVRRRILAPAGMARAALSVAGFRAMAERAAPYFPGEEGRVALPLRDTDPVAPAAGLYADIGDAARYLELLAGGGTIDGMRVLPEAALRAARSQAVAAGGRSRHPELGARGYGLGLNLSTYRGRPMIHHPGVVDGYGAYLAVLPDDRLGAIVLGNMSGPTPTPRIVARSVLDRLLGDARTDWIARYGHRRPPPRPKQALPPPVPPDRPAAAYAGRYRHPAYGTMTLAAGPDDTLAGAFHGRAFVLIYAGRDAWRLTGTHWPLREGLAFRFREFGGGHFARMETPLADGPTYRHRAGPLAFQRLLSQDAPGATSR